MFKFGNHKLSNDTIVFNMCSASKCPSAKLGLCKLKDMVRCYALKAEQTYKAVKPYRERQAKYWKEADPKKMAEEMKKIIKRRKLKTKYFRFNEAGDFRNQEDINKLSLIAESLKEEDITTYGYTARGDLDFSEAKFLIKGSGYDIKGSTGKTIVIGKKDPVPEGFVECPGSCKKCSWCKIDEHMNIAFRKH